MSRALRCTPKGPMAAPEAGEWLCRCGEKLTAVECKGTDDWTYITASGEVCRDDTPAGLKEDPDKWWADLARNDIGAYSNGRAAIGIYGDLYWIHGHQPLSAEDHAPAVPWCCGWPMWACPSGWACRVNKTIFPYSEPPGGGAMTRKPVPPPDKSPFPGRPKPEQVPPGKPTPI